MKLTTAEYNKYLSWLLVLKDITKELDCQDSLENTISKLEQKLEKK